MNFNAFLYILAESDRWNDFAETYLRQWDKRLQNWVLNNTTHPVHVVNYEDLRNDTVREVEKILDFLHFPYSHDELVERLREDFTAFQRVHKNDGFQHFSPEQKEQLRLALEAAVTGARDSGKTRFFRFDDYLESLAGSYHLA